MYKKHKLRFPNRLNSRRCYHFQSSGCLNWLRVLRHSLTWCISGSMTFAAIKWLDFFSCFDFISYCPSLCQFEVLSECSEKVSAVGVCSAFFLFPELLDQAGGRFLIQGYEVSHHSLYLVLPVLVIGFVSNELISKLRATELQKEVVLNRMEEEFSLSFLAVLVHHITHDWEVHLSELVLFVGLLSFFAIFFNE